MSWTSPKTVAITTLPLVWPSIRSRWFSSCATARFITSADCRTNGRISSPAPNLSPTSFIAGSSTLFRVGTAPIFSTERSIQSSTPSFFRWRICQWSASSGSIPSVGSPAASSASSPLDSKWAMNFSRASSEWLKTRSSVSSRSWSGISAYGVMWFGFTIARSSPAWTQWCRKTELRTAWAGGETPKETLETPSEVFTPGSSALTRLIPSIVSIADGRHSSSPVVRVKVSASKIRASGSSPCSSVQSWWIRLATSSLRSAVFAMPLIDGQGDHAGAMGLGQRHDPVELLPSGLQVDRVDDRPARDSLECRLDHLRLRGVDLDRRRLGQRDAFHDGPHLSVLVLALGERHADVEHVRAAGDLVLRHLEQAVVVVGQQHLLGRARALGVDPLADQRGARFLDQRGRGHHR